MTARYYLDNTLLYGEATQDGFITEAGDIIPLDEVEILED